MAELPLTTLALCGFSFLAGFIDSIVGGGGLILVPALFVLMPAVPAATLLGTNKATSIWGTLAATIQYMRRVPVEWRSTLPSCIAAVVASYFGARAVAHVPSDFLRPLVLLMLAAVLVYTLWKKDLGSLHAPRLSRSQQVWAGLLTGAILGFYDGFFGPGTGSFLIFAFVGIFGFSFLAASASAKLVNLITNFAAFAYFATHGHVLYTLALPMAAFNVAGSVIGSQLAIRKGSGFVRALFIVVVLALMARLAWDYLSMPH